MRLRSVSALAAICALVAVFGVSSLSSAIADGGSVATASKKKKCTKKKRKKGKCKKAAATDPVAAATRFLSGKRLFYFSYSNNTGASTQEAFDFCVNHTLFFKGDYVGGSGFAWQNSFDGTWNVTSATGTSASVAMTAQNWQSGYGEPAPPPSFTVQMALTGPNTVVSGGVTYSLQSAPC